MAIQSETPNLRSRSSLLDLVSRWAEKDQDVTNRTFIKVLNLLKTYLLRGLSIISNWEGGLG